MHRPARSKAGNPTRASACPKRARGTVIGASAKQRPVIPQDYARGVVAGGAGDAAAGMRAGAAMVEALQGAPIVGMAEDRARREQLVQRQRTMKNIAAEQPELAFQIERRQNLPPHDRSCKA